MTSQKDAHGDCDQATGDLQGSDVVIVMWFTPWGSLMFQILITMRLNVVSSRLLYRFPVGFLKAPAVYRKFTYNCRNDIIRHPRQSGLISLRVGSGKCDYKVLVGPDVNP